MSRNTIKQCLHSNQTLPSGAGGIPSRATMEEVQCIPLVDEDSLVAVYERSSTLPAVKQDGLL